MDDDFESDENIEEDEDEQDRNIKSYSKRKHFGKTSRDIKLFALRTNLKFNRPSLRPLRVSVENTWAKSGSVPFHSLKLKHKDTNANVSSKSKMSVSWNSLKTFRSWDLNSILSYRLQNSTLGLTLKANHKLELGAKLSQSFKFWEDWKLKGILESEYKPGKGPVYSWGIAVDRHKSLNKLESFKSISQINYATGINLNSRLWGRYKGDIFYRGHMVFGQGHKIFMEHKASHDSSQGTFNNALTVSYQQSLGIGTINGHVAFQNRAIKTKEFRFVIEFYKSLAFGIQRRNEVFELMFLKTKIGYNWLKKFQLNVGNRGLLASCEGKIKALSADYSLYYKLKQIQNNLYDDSSFGLTLRLNP